MINIQQVKRSSLCVSTLFLSQLGLSSVAFAQEHSEGFVQHEVHQHGVSELMIVKEGNTLTLVLEAPANDVIGFEHVAKSDEEKKKVEMAKAVLANTSQLFTLSSSAQCAIQNLAISSGVLASQSHEEHEHEEHEHEEKHAHKDDHDHEDEHGHESEHDHDHEEQHAHEGEHDHDDHHQETHQGFTANYQFNCENMASLKELSVNWFEFFPASEKMNVQFVDESSQKQFSLDKQSFTISF